jgi:hypothetical protein
MEDAGLTAARRKGESTIEVHHLLEDRLMEQFGIKRSEGWSVGLEADDHAVFSGELPRHLPRKRFFDIDDVFNAHAEMYRDHGHPEWVDEMRAFLRQNRQRIRSRYEQGRLPGASDPDFVERRQRALRFLDTL